MEQSVGLDVSGYSRVHKGREAPMWWGIAGLIVIEGMVVSAFIASYFYLFLIAPVWPPPGFPEPDLFWPTVSAALLLASAGAMWWAGREISRDRLKSFLFWLFAAVALDTAVLGVRWLQFLELDFRWDTHAYGSLVWTITGFHFVHVLSAVLGTLVVGVLGIYGYFDKERQLAVVVDTLYWYFVSFVWLPLYFVLYWVPRLW